MRFINIHIIFPLRKTLLARSVPKTISLRHTSHMSWFKESLSAANNIVIISGDDISSESGLPLYTANDHWRKYPVSSLGTSAAFLTFPSLIWEFYHHRRDIVSRVQPTEAHKAIAQFEEKYGSVKSITVITQSIDGLHARAGSKKLIELNGNLFKTRCIKCNDVLINNDSPICEALANKGSPDDKNANSDIPEKLLPHCNKDSCSGLLRPDIIWFGEPMDPSVVAKAEEAISSCDICLVVGSASRMFPTAFYASEAKNGGAIIAEFNEVRSPKVEFHYSFEGPYSKTVSQALEL